MLPPPRPTETDTSGPPKPCCRSRTRRSASCSAAPALPENRALTRRLGTRRNNRGGWPAAQRGGFYGGENAGTLAGDRVGHRRNPPTKQSEPNGWLRRAPHPRQLSVAGCL